LKINKIAIDTGIGQIDEWVGLGWAIAIVVAWFGSGAYFLSHAYGDFSWLAIGGGILMRTFLHTGLFILAHDAMHGNLCPSSPRWNHLLGSFAVRLYACLSYEECCANHYKHHHQPGELGDPDFHDGIHAHPCFWYWQFMGKYLSWEQFWGFVSVFLAIALPLKYFANVAYLNLLLFGLLPIFLSSIQLFFFGTYLPHGKLRPMAEKVSEEIPEEQPQPRETRFSVRSSLRLIWSFVSCYHFGVYHEQHHDFPRKPWFKLPTTGISQSSIF
jgi:beta-carotene ketolase (CrtW type)